MDERVSETGDDDNVAYFTKNGQFKGNCNYCGKYGHKKEDCPKMKADSVAWLCTYCGAKGHKEYKCELKKAHQKGLGSERANVAIDDSDVRGRPGYNEELGF